ncbi:MAG: SpoIIE family protein phosphatase [Acidobacteriota bacterium]
MSFLRKIVVATGSLAGLTLAWWVVSATGAVDDPPLLVKSFAVAGLLAVSAWLLRIVLRRFLWRVSRRLAFSYFLMGVVPIPLVACLVALVLYILGGFFIGHLYMNALESVQRDLHSAARVELDRLRGQLDGRAPQSGARFSYYRGGRRFAGDPNAPALLRDVLPTRDLGDMEEGPPALFLGTDGRPTLFAAATAGRLAVVARLQGSLDAELRRRTGLWVEIARPSTRAEEDRVILHLWGRQFPVEGLKPQASTSEIRSFFIDRRRLAVDAEAPDLPLTEKPWLVWLELSRPFLDPLTGEEVEDYLTATLVTSPAALIDQLTPSAPEVNLFVYLALLTVFLVTLNLYIIALLMALLLIFNLSRAVNRLTTANRRIEGGDFKTRIEVFRRDQIGALQAGFNQMAGNLERLVDEEAKKEIFERELQIAAQMQQSLLPDTLDAPAALRFATFFEPSRAIGGDYYDLIRLADGRLALVIADVAGHGLPAGLRMAMVKSAFELLCQELDSPKEILRRLHHLLRERLHQRGEHRAFVSATVAVFDLESGRLEIVGAGHPPTYRLRRGEVRPFELPGPPLGILPPTLPTAHTGLEPGDVFLWLSDGLIEATDCDGEVFGYPRIVETLRGLPADPETVKDTLLQAVAAHTGQAAGEHMIDDDLTLLVVGYDPDATSTGAPALPVDGDDQSEAQSSEIRSSESRKAAP